MRLLLCVALVCLVAALTRAYDIDEYKMLIESLDRNATVQADFERYLAKLLELEPNYYDYTPFPDSAYECALAPSPQVPTSVHKLRPSDIKVVGALGDSLTASLGSNAKTILGLLIEYRGRSWSVGGDRTLEKLVTLPNILKKFNPNLKGYNTGSDIMFLTKKGKGLNVAVSGQEANHILEQATRLVERLKEAKDVDYNNDWKLITLFIGGNDLCRYCKDKTKHAPDAYVADIKAGLDLLYKEVPRAFVNLVSVLNVPQVKFLNEGLICKALHKWGCACAAYPASEDAEKELVEYTKAYQQKVQDLVDSGIYDVREDFTVVLQPFMRDMLIPRTMKDQADLSYFAPDCFHMSTKGHAAAAIGLWNNIVQPIGRKSTTWVLGEQLVCPTNDRPYLYTKKNSD